MQGARGGMIRRLFFGFGVVVAFSAPALAELAMTGAPVAMRAGPASNARIVQFDIAAFYTFRDGRIAEIREIMDTFDLVQQVLERDVVADLASGKFHA